MKKFSLIAFLGFMFMGSYIPNSVSSLGSKRRMEHLVMSGTTCTGSPCTVTYTSVASTTVTRSGVGSYTINWGTSWASTSYSCTMTSLNNAAAAFGLISAKTTSSLTITSIKPSNEQVIDASYDVICMGPR